MRMRCVWLCLAGLVVSGLSMPAATAGVLTFEFEGAVSSLTGNTGIFGLPGEVQEGDSFTGRFSYEIGPGNPDQLPDDPTQGAYDLLVFQIDQAVAPIDPLGLLIIHAPGTPSLPPAPPDPGTDGVRVFGMYTTPGFEPRLFSLRLEAEFDAVFSDVSLPLDLVLDDFPLTREVRATVTVGLPDGPPGQADVGHIRTLIPEPNAIALLGLGGLLLLRRGGGQKDRQTGRRGDTVTNEPRP